MAHKLEALHTVPASSWGVSIDGGATVYVSSGDCYMSSAAPGGTESLMTKLATLLSATVASTTVTGVVTSGILRTRITWGSGSHSLTWVSTTLRDRLGFTGNLSSAATHNASNQPMGVWLPIGDPSGLLSSYGSLGSRESDKVTHVARSGKVWSTGYNKRTKQRLTWNGQTAAKMWKESENAATNESAERLYEDFLASGKALRWYQGTGTTGYQTALGENRDYYVTNPNFEPERMFRHDAAWRWTLDLVAYV